MLVKFRIYKIPTNYSLNVNFHSDITPFVRGKPRHRCFFKPHFLQSNFKQPEEILQQMLRLYYYLAHTILCLQLALHAVLQEKAQVR